MFDPSMSGVLTGYSFTISSRKYLSELKGLSRKVNFRTGAPNAVGLGGYYYFSDGMKDNVWPISVSLFACQTKSALPTDGTLCRSLSLCRVEA